MWNKSPVTSDEGNLETKSYLPIRTLLYGDTGSSIETIDSTLGPVKCYFNYRMYILSIISLPSFVPFVRFLVRITDELFVNGVPAELAV